MADYADARRRAEEDLLHVIEWLESGHWMACQPLFADDGAKAREKGQRLRALLAAGPEGKAPREYGPCPNYREGQSHAGCNLCGGLGTLPILSDADIAPPPPSDAVREAAERLRQLLRPPVTMTPDGYAFFRVEDVETVLCALAARGGE